MIDHVSIGVTDLAMATDFYCPVFLTLGIKRITERPGTVGFGKKYPEIWLNHRPNKERLVQDSGTHICFRAPSIDAVDEFYNVAIEQGAESSGTPGYREEYRSPAYRSQEFTGYYAAFIRDKDQNHIEVVTFV